MKRYLINFTVSGRDKGNDKPMQYVYTARNDEDVQGIKESVAMQMELTFNAKIEVTGVEEIE